MAAPVPAEFPAMGSVMWAAPRPVAAPDNVGFSVNGKNYIIRVQMVDGVLMSSGWGVVGEADAESDSIIAILAGITTPEYLAALFAKAAADALAMAG